MSHKKALFSSLVFIFLFTFSPSPTQKARAADSQYCGEYDIGSHSGGDVHFNYDCDNVTFGVNIFFGGNGSSAAQSTIGLPRLKVDRDQDIMPKQALAYTPVVISPKWETSGVFFATNKIGKWVIDADHYWDHITIYIQASPAYLSNDTEGVPFIQNYVFFRSDASIPFHGMDILSDQSVVNQYFMDSPAWNLSSAYGGLLTSDCLNQIVGEKDWATDKVDINSFTKAIACSVHCTPGRHDYYGATCDNNSVSNPLNEIGNLPMLAEDVIGAYDTPLSSHWGPEFAYITPYDPSSKNGSYTDPKSNQKSFYFSVKYGWQFRVWVVGNYWVQHHDTIDMCEWTDRFDRNGQPCYPDKPSPGFYYSRLERYSYWVQQQFQVELPDVAFGPNTRGGMTTDDTWVVDKILFDGSLTNAVTIPVYQALPILAP